MGGGRLRACQGYGRCRYGGDGDRGGRGGHDSQGPSPGEAWLGPRDRPHSPRHRRSRRVRLRRQGTLGSTRRCTMAPKERRENRQILERPQDPSLPASAREPSRPWQPNTPCSQGDEFAASLVNWLARVTAAGIAGLTAIYDPEAVFVGGGLAEALGPGFLGKVTRHLGTYAMRGRVPLVERASFGRLQALQGARAIAIRTPSSLERLNKRWQARRQTGGGV